jgi:hypothetical protein
MARLTASWSRRPTTTPATAAISDSSLSRLDPGRLRRGDGDPDQDHAQLRPVGSSTDATGRDAKHGVPLRRVRPS